MKRILLTATLAVTALGYVCGQAKPAAKPAAKAAPAAAAKPKYAGFYINGKLVDEISCYGFDEYNIVYPYFPALESSDRYWLRVVAGSYDQAGKFVLEYSDNKSLYEEANLEAIKEKYAERGYGIVSKSNLLDDYNRHRATHPTSNYVVDLDNASVNVLKYTNLDPATTKGSVIYYEIYMAKIKGYETKYDEANSRTLTLPVYQQGALVYTSPKTKLTNRILASTVATKPGAEASAEAAPAGEQPKKQGKFGRALSAAANAATSAVNDVAARATSDSQTGPVVSLLPEIQAETCEPKGKDVSLDQVKEVGRGKYGEAIMSN